MRYAIKTVTGAGSTVIYPPHNTSSDLWSEVESWPLDDNHHVTFCKTKESYQEWAECFDESPVHDFVVRFPCWITESHGHIDFETTKAGFRDFVWSAHFHDCQSSAIMQMDEE